MELISKFNKGFLFLLCAIDCFLSWVIPSKDKKGATITNAFQKNLDESNRKPNKVWVDKGSKFYNRSMQSFLKNNAVEMYSTHNGGKSLITERYIRTLKNKIYKYMTSISNNVYIDKLDGIVNKYNNTYHSTIKMKPVVLKSSTYIHSSKEVNRKHPKFKIGDIVRISKYKNIFEKGYTPNWSKENFVIEKVENAVPWTYATKASFKNTAVVDRLDFAKKTKLI